MKRRYLNLLIDLLWDSPMWAFLLVGIVLVAASILVGPWLENRRITWQRDLVQAQADRLAQQEQAYTQLETALQRNDPVLIERLAFHYLHLKPQGAELLLQAAQRTPSGVRGVRLVAERQDTVDNWAYRPMPVVGQDFPRYSLVDNLLIRVTTGPLHLVLLVLAGACILLGMIPLAQIARKPAHLALVEPTPALRPSACHGAVLLPSAATDPITAAPPPAVLAPQDSTSAVSTPAAIPAAAPAIPTPPPPPVAPSISAAAYLADENGSTSVALIGPPLPPSAAELAAEPDEAMVIDPAPPAGGADQPQANPPQGSLF